MFLTAAFLTAVLKTSGMLPASSDPPHSAQTAPREFAFQVVRQLRDAGYQAFWAGGCVRDQLLGKIPKDYDVASSATPDQVIQLFGKRRTIPVGASFGVIMVLGPRREAGQIEVATFRSDGKYLDGRRPESVQFCSAEEDAQRRDFTINGMFYDPISSEVIDFVGGREDLAAGIVRAIGDAASRFAEDKLRMLRAIRFTATFGFELEQDTENAIRRSARQLNEVSMERIADELRRMFSHLSRERAFELLRRTHLLEILFPSVFTTQPSVDSEQLTDRLETCGKILAALRVDRFEPSLCAIFLPLLEPGENLRDRTVKIRRQCDRLKLSRAETDHIVWLADSLQSLAGAEQRPLHVLKPLLADSRSPGLLDLSAAIAAAYGAAPVDADHCRRYLSQVSFEQLRPEPLVGGRDLHDLSVETGPKFRQLLDIIRQEQLDELLTSREQALLRLKQLVQQDGPV